MHPWNKLLQRSECKWVSATNGDNAYGSEVVERILGAPHLQNSAAQPDMLLLPMDSAKYAELGQQKLLLESFIKYC